MDVDENSRRPRERRFFLVVYRILYPHPRGVRWSKKVRPITGWKGIREVFFLIWAWPKGAVVTPQKVGGQPGKTTPNSLLWKAWLFAQNGEIYGWQTLGVLCVVVDGGIVKEKPAFILGCVIMAVKFSMA